MQDNDGKTPLYLAGERGHWDEVYLLLKRGTNVHLKATKGDTILHLASERKRLTLVFKLTREYPSLVLE